MISFVQVFRKHELIYSDRKQNRGCLGQGEVMGRRKVGFLQRGMNVYICQNLSNWQIYVVNA